MKTYEKKVGGSFRGLERISGRVHNGDVGSAVMDAGRSMERLGIYLSKQNAEASALEQQERAQEDDLTTRQKSGILRNKLKESYISDVESKSGDERKEAYMSWREGKAKELYGSVIDEKVNDRVRGVLDNSFEEILGGYDVSQAKWGNEKRMYEANEVLKTERTIYTDDAMRHMDADYYFSSQAENLKGYSLHNKVDARSGYVKGGYDKESAVFATKYVNEQIKRSNLTGASEMIKKYSAQIPAETVKILEDSIRLEKDYETVCKDASFDDGKVSLCEAYEMINEQDNLSEYDKTFLKQKVVARVKEDEDIEISKKAITVQSFAEKISKETYTDAMRSFKTSVESKPAMRPLFEMQMKKYFNADMSQENAQAVKAQKITNAKHFLKYQQELTQRILSGQFKGKSNEEVSVEMSEYLYKQGLDVESVGKLTEQAISKRKAIAKHVSAVEGALMSYKGAKIENLPYASAMVINSIDNIEDKTTEEVKIEINKAVKRVVLITQAGGLWGESDVETTVGGLMKNDFKDYHVLAKDERKTIEGKIDTALFSQKSDDELNALRRDMLKVGILSGDGGLLFDESDPKITDDFYNHLVKKLPMTQATKKRIEERKKRVEAGLTEEQKKKRQLLLTGKKSEAIGEVYNTLKLFQEDKDRRLNK